MKVTFDTEEEQGLFMRLVHPTKYSTAKVADVVKAIYEANLEEDIRSAIEHLDEVGE
jgi:hypothetical protein